MEIWPESGRISPAISESRVDFPLPDRPTRLVVSPCGRSSSRSFRTSSREEPLPYAFETASRRTNGCPVGLSETKTAPSARVSGTFVYTTRVRQKKALDFTLLKKAQSHNQPT